MTTKTKKEINLGHGYKLNPANGGLLHPSGHLCSWFRHDSEGGFVPLEWAAWIHPEFATRICAALRDPEVIAGRVHLPLRGKYSVIGKGDA
jgi:hypothetical protein